MNRSPSATREASDRDGGEYGFIMECGSAQSANPGPDSDRDGHSNRPTPVSANDGDRSDERMDGGWVSAGCRLLARALERLPSGKVTDLPAELTGG